MSFVHLRAHSHYSVQKGLLGVEDLVAKAVENGHDAVALTDLSTMFGFVSFQDAAKSKGVKPIVGLEVLLDTDLTDPDNRDDTRLLLIAENNEGYSKLMQLITRANMENLRDTGAYVKQSWFKEMGTEGLLALTGNPDHGEIPRAACLENASDAGTQLRKVLPVYRELFPDRLFLEVSRYGHEKEDLWVQRLAQLSASTQIPLVATHDVLFKNREDFFAHEVHSAISAGQQVLDPTYIPAATREQYYRSTEEMEELFSDLPQAVENASLLGQRCNVNVKLGVNHLPNYPLPEGESSIDEYFVKSAKAGLEDRLKKLFPDDAVRSAKRPEYVARLDEEINVILNMKFPGYFLVVSDFIRWSKKNGVPVGPGRGSGAGSLVAYSLNITDLDPIEHSLLFERFLNPERVSMPDIDVDFCRDRRDDTLKYLFERYGHDSVAQISTLMTLAAKAAIRHSGKALNYPHPRVDEIARLVPKRPDISLEEALEEEPKLKELYDNEKTVRRLLDMALKLEGSTLSYGVHAGGIVISPTRIDDFSPMAKAEKGVMVTQFDKDDVEKAGLIKFDLLGLKTLTLLDRARDLINERPDRQDNPLVLEDISIHDPGALELLRQGNTYAIFQLESRGMSKLVKELKPDTFEDVVALLALYRPGPLGSGMVESFVRRKHGEEEISYYHPKIEKILRPTYGIIVYQEQVMQIAQEIAGYTLGGADLLRRAMGKKKPEEMAKERSKFEAGAAANGVDAELATELFNVMEKFAEYGFNRSHSAAYAVLSMQTAYLKANYPAEYFAAYMNVEIQNTDVLSLAVTDLRNMNLTILPPDINTGFSEFKAIDDGKISYGLAALKGSSIKSIDDIVAARETHGNFESLPDFLHKVNKYMRDNGRNMQLKGVTEALINAGAFDSINPNRAELSAALPEQLDYLGKLNRRQAAKSNEAGEVLLPSLWDAVGIVPIPAPTKASRKQKPLEEPVWPLEGEVMPWSDLEKLTREAKSIGYYLTGHPFFAHAQELGGLKAAIPLEQVNDYEDNPYNSVLVAGVVAEMREHVPANGRKMAFVKLSDGDTEVETTVFADAYELGGKKIKPGAFVAFEANIKPPRKEGRRKDVLVQQIFSKDDLRALLVKEVHVALSKEELSTLKDVAEQHHGDRVSCVAYLPDGPDRYFRAELKDIKFSGSVECLEKLRDTFPHRIKFEFTPKLSFAPAARSNKKPFPNGRR